MMVQTLDDAKREDARQPTNPILGILLRDWITDTRKSDAHDGADNHRERRIIDLAGKPATPMTGMLYRGQGVPDHVVCDLHTHNVAMLPASKRLISSWTTSLEVARDFAADAAGEGMSALVISMPAEMLDVVVDVLTLDVDASEREVIVLNRDLHLTMDQVQTIWRYDDEKEASEIVRDRPDPFDPRISRKSRLFGFACGNGLTGRRETLTSPIKVSPEAEA